MILFTQTNFITFYRFWRELLILLLTPATNELHPSFKYIICSIGNFTQTNRSITFKIFLLLDYRYVETESDHWTNTSKFLKHNNFRFGIDYENPLANKYWVLNESIYLLEKGSIKCDVQNYVYTTILCQYPITNTRFFTCRQTESNESTQLTALIIEEYLEEIQYPYSNWCLAAREMGILNPNRMKYVSTIHLIHPSNAQTYHTFGLERNTHYSLHVTKLDSFKWIVEQLGIPLIEYKSEIGFTKTENLCVINNTDNNSSSLKDMYTVINEMKNTNILRKRNDIWLVSYGFSGRAKKGKSGDPPNLTITIGGKSKTDTSLLSLALPILEKLSAEILTIYADKILIDETRNMHFAQKLGTNFKLNLNGPNIFEGFDCAVTDGLAGCELNPHCDAKNDWRPGYNYCSVTKTIVHDTNTNNYMQIVLIAYTRKDVGDYLYGSKYYLAT